MSPDEMRVRKVLANAGKWMRALARNPTVPTVTRTDASIWADRVRETLGDRWQSHEDAPARSTENGIGGAA